MRGSEEPSLGQAGASRTRLPDGRWHFQHGPIDLIIGADGEPGAVAQAVEEGWVRFQAILAELVAELRLLRSPTEEATAVCGAVARRMVVACWPHRAQFITPMAAVAGAVADELIESFRAKPTVRRAYVNNGGDIALHLSAGEQYRIGLFADLSKLKRHEAQPLDGDFQVTAKMPVRGVATSGWRGRSFSFGIADSVTVLARSAAAADAAATMVGNAITAEDPAIVRRPACELKDDTDLGDRLVTVEVGPLARSVIDRALAAGENHAHMLVSQGTILGAVLVLRGAIRVVGVAAGRPGDEQIRRECWLDAPVHS